MRAKKEKKKVKLGYLRVVGKIPRSDGVHFSGDITFWDDGSVSIWAVDESGNKVICCCYSGGKKTLCLYPPRGKGKRVFELKERKRVRK